MVEHANLPPVLFPLFPSCPLFSVPSDTRTFRPAAPPPRGRRCACRFMRHRALLSASFLPLIHALSRSHHHSALRMSNWDAERGIWVGGKALSTVETPRPLYIFGYGSLCWKPEPLFEGEGASSFIGVMDGWQRRFAQRSMDHRGTPERPGWTVTCVSDEDLEALGARSAEDAPSLTHGRCYRIPDDRADQVLHDLDVREKGGYTRAVVTVRRFGGAGGAKEEEGEGEGEGEEDGAVTALLYTGATDNPLFELQDEETIARDIAEAVGPSGPNSEYLFMLEAFLEDIGAEDAHIRGLSELVRERQAAGVGSA